MAKTVPWPWAAALISIAIYIPAPVLWTRKKHWLEQAHEKACFCHADHLSYENMRLLLLRPTSALPCSVIVLRAQVQYFVDFGISALIRPLSTVGHRLYSLFIPYETYPQEPLVILQLQLNFCERLQNGASS